MKLAIVAIALLVTLCSAEVCTHNNVYIGTAGSYIANITSFDLPYISSTPDTNYDVVMLEDYFTGQFLLFYNGSRVGVTFSLDNTIPSSLSTNSNSYPAVFTLVTWPYYYFYAYVMIPPGLRLVSATHDTVWTQWSYLLPCSGCYTWQVYEVPFISYTTTNRNSIVTNVVNSTSTSYTLALFDPQGNGINVTGPCPYESSPLHSEVSALGAITVFMFVFLIVTTCMT